METMIINQQNKIEYNNVLQDVIIAVLNAAAEILKIPDNSEVSVLLVDNNSIKELNALYRNINEDTDVLSFAMNEFSEDEPEFINAEEINMLGDIVISLEKALFQSVEYEHKLSRELGFLVAHGILHLLGYDHEKPEEEEIMQKMQEKILTMVKLER